MRLLLFLLLPTLALAQRAPVPTPPSAAKAAARPAPAKRPAPLPATAVPWSAGRPLTVADFQGRPGPTEPHAALASATIDAKGACSGNVFTAEVRAVFDPNTSWVREPATMSAALLRHEQLHFDIAEIYARQLRLRLAGAHPNCAQLQSTFGRISQAVYTEWEREEARYDQETSHGLNAVQQTLWERQTAVRLQQLAAYALKEAE
ncbi:DUF922 domain-containing protein [uncultured Hymenobacter sp.]|uniref:DUF922 domain-containing protein n=1 Tax=uncultured Hymenobacter sp. TaxID=170016 RepID=UPI0035CB7061